MSFEIERRFLVCQDVRHFCRHGDRIVQGYISFDNGNGGQKARVRIRNDQAFLTIKGERRGLVRPEFERVVSLSWANGLLSRLPPDTLIHKTRYEVEFAGMTWEIDVFNGRNSGLVVAEIELEHAEQEIELPDWVGAEVTFDERYGNSSLSVRPVSTWPAAA
ncbi:MAG TPA: CYTH domain-containing protein [Skermanella sp.]|jgi:adenylate cyclase|nr:CYTH domain-containing protein [Skermanella sp.]